MDVISKSGAEGTCKVKEIALLRMDLKEQNTVGLHLLKQLEWISELST